MLLGTYGATMASGVLSHNTAQADLTLTKTASPDPVTVGEQLTYTLVVTNNGPATSTNATLEDILPDSVTFVSATATSGTCSQSSGIVTCELGDLSLGQIATSTILVIPNVPMDITNTAHVGGDQNDPHESDNDSSEITTVVASSNQADLSVDKASSPNPVILGEFLTYTVEVVNLGAATSTDVVLVDTLPVDVTFSSATSTSGTCSESGGVVTCSIGTLLPDHSAIVTIVVIADHVGESVNSVEVSGDETDPIPDNNTTSMTLSVIEIATEMEIGIGPGSDRSPLNLRGKGTLPVAILGATNFDVHDIDVSTVRFGVNGDNQKPEHHKKGHRKGDDKKSGHITDINRDGIDDMVLHFKSHGLGIDRSVEQQRGLVTLILTGELEDGTSFDGEDTVTIVGKGHLKPEKGPHGKSDKHHDQYDDDDGDDWDDDKSKGRGRGRN